MTHRLVSILDEAFAISDALVKLQKYAKAYSWTNEVDFDKACSAVGDFIGQGKAYVIDGYLVMIDVIQPWYSNDSVLQEWLVLKLYDGGSVDSVPPALLAIAKERGCKSVATADSSPISIVADAYTRAGFLPLTRSFTKEVP